MNEESKIELGPTISQRRYKDSERYKKLRRWMSSNVEEGWNKVEELAAIACYLGQEAFDESLDALGECNVGLCHKKPEPVISTEESRQNLREWSLKMATLEEQEDFTVGFVPFPGCTVLDLDLIKTETQILLGLAYSKLLKFGVENSDPLLMDQIKLELLK